MSMSAWGERALAFYVPSRSMGLIVFTSGANGRKVIRDIVSEVYPENQELNAFSAMQASD